MKKYAIFAMVLVLTLSLLTGCGCTAKKDGMTTMPSTNESFLPTNIPETTVPTEPATMPATMPTMDATDPMDGTETGTAAATEDSNDGPITDGMTRSRSRMR